MTGRDPESVREDLDGPGFGVNVLGSLSAATDSSVAARATISALLDAGVDVATADTTPAQRRTDDTFAHLHVTDTARLPHPVTLVHDSPIEGLSLWERFPHWFAESYNCIAPLWELPDVPAAWNSLLSNYDAVLAPTSHIAAAIRNTVSTPVRSFPLAASIGSLVSIKRREYGIPEDKFAFATGADIGSGAARTNGVGVLRAFEAALDMGADAVLVVTLQGGETDPVFARAVARLPDSAVVMVDRFLPRARLLGLCSACDAYVSVHRADGLGLGMQEAMLLGKPVIATGWSGNLDFMDESCAALVRHRLTPVVDPHPGYAPGEFSRTQLWAEPDLLHAAEHMCALVADPGLRARLGAAGRERLGEYRGAWLRAAPLRLESLYRAA